MTGNAWLYKHKRVINVNGSVLSIDKYEPAGSFVHMARKLRVEYEGAIYHVMNRGDRREAVFRDAADRELFLRTLAEACRKKIGRASCRGRVWKDGWGVVEKRKGKRVAW